MKDFLKRLWRDRRGNALVIAAAATPLIVGSAGLASDTVHWALWKRQMQRAADSAALAAVYARAQSPSLSQAGIETIVAHDLDENNHMAVGLLGGYPIVTTPPDVGEWTYHVKVRLAVQKKLGFSSLFLPTAPIIETAATAAMVPDGYYCLVALKKTGVALNLQGSASVSMGCGAISNSISANSVNNNGGAYSFVADPVASAGGMPSSINGATDLQPYHTPLPDPFKDKYSTTLPSGVTCGNYQSHFNNATNTLSPGCLTSFPNGSFTMAPGVYYLQNTGISLAGNALVTGTGVTIIFGGSTPGTLTMNGNSSMNIKAPTDATCGVFAGFNSCNYKKMLMIQSANATEGNDVLINGDNETNLDGAIYFPKADVTISGSSTASTKCAMVVAYTLDFSGNTAIQNNTTGCTANQKVAAKNIRLVA